MWGEHMNRDEIYIRGMRISKAKTSRHCRVGHVWMNKEEATKLVSFLVKGFKLAAAEVTDEQ